MDALLDYLTNLDALCLCANIRDKEGRLPIAPYAVHQLENGLRIGLVGVCSTSSAAGRTPKRSSSSSSKNLCPPPKPRWKAVKPLCDLTVLIYPRRI